MLTPAAPGCLLAGGWIRDHDGASRDRVAELVRKAGRHEAELLELGDGDLEAAGR